MAKKGSHQKRHNRTSTKGKLFPAGRKITVSAQKKIDAIRDKYHQKIKEVTYNEYYTGCRESFCSEYELKRDAEIQEFKQSLDPNEGGKAITITPAVVA